MKKVYLLTVALLSGTLVNAQMARSGASEGKQKSHVAANIMTRNAAPSQSNTPAAIIWSNDFSNAADWTLTTAPGTAGDWVIGSVPPSGLFPISPIATTGDFALYDSDLLCTYDQIGRLTNTNAIDLTGHPAVRLTFSQYYRRFHDSTYVYVSNNGTSWSRYEVNAGILTNQYSANNPNLNPDIVNIDISVDAGNQATVYIRFEFYSPDTNAAGYDSLSGCGYSWMIDDVSISDIASTDAALMPPNGGEYSIFPVIQPEALQLRGRLINTGSSAITGGKIMFNIYDINGLQFTDSSAASGTLNPGDTSAYLACPNTYTVPQIGFYGIEQLVMVPGDGDNTNDTAYIELYADDSTYARDITALPGQGAAFEGGYGFNGTTTGAMGQMFEIWHASDLTSATFFLASDRTGKNVSIDVYSVTGGVPDALMGSTAVYTIQSGDTVLVTLPFTNPISVTPGNYFVAINQLDTGNITIGAASEFYTPQKGFFRATGGAWTPFENSNLNIALILRVNNPATTLVGVKDVAEKVKFNVFPNPSTGMIYVAGNDEKDVTVEVTNSLGQVVKTVKYDRLTINRLDLNNAPSGLYNVHFKSATGELTKTIMIQ